ncbi:MAG: hypothetical protein U0525_03645 [Patescibacteria group bacterium]
MISDKKLTLNFEVLSARYSNQALLPAKYIHVPLSSVGVHEKPNNLRGDQMVSVMISIIAKGFLGPAISVMQFGSDDIYSETKSLDRSIIKDIKFGEIGIADGHNRLAALNVLQELGLFSSKYFPVQIIPGRKPDLVDIRVSRDGETPLKISDIEKCFKDRNITINPNSTSHFETFFADGNWRRIREGQPDISIDRNALINKKRLYEIRQNLVPSDGLLNLLKMYSIRLDDLVKILQSSK